MTLSPLRSAICWRIRIAFWWTVLTTPFSEFGTSKPRAKPAASHSLVTPCHLPSASWTSTSSQPPISGHFEPAEYPGGGTKSASKVALVVPLGSNTAPYVVLLLAHAQ